jgi:hypothetical protein
VGGHTAETFYPGDEWVDWVAIDGYNWGASENWSSWKSAAQTYDDMLFRLRALSSRPVALTEFASTSSTLSGANIAAKSQWITDTLIYAVANDIGLLCWFNTDKETDWAMFGGANGDSQFKLGRTTYRAYSAYRSALGIMQIVPASALNPRLLTDSQFAGH